MTHARAASSPVEITKLFGLPAHPLLVHVPVVLIPLAAVGVVAMLIRPVWVTRFGWLVVAAAGVGWLGAIFAAQSGESLEGTLRSAGQPFPPSLSRHTELGSTAEFLAGVLFFTVLAWVGFVWWRRRVGEEKAVATTKQPKTIAIVLSVLALVAAGISTAWIIGTGHSGAKSVWEQTQQSGR